MNHLKRLIVEVHHGFYWLFFPLLLVTLMSCGGDFARFRSTLVRDSAGIRIVENTDYQWPQVQGWWLSEQPLLDIGAVEGD